MQTRSAHCSCGKVEVEVGGTPIATVACYCDDCQEGSRRIEALPRGLASQEQDGSTHYVLYRKDRVRTLRGAELLDGLKLKPGAPTNRVVARCCGAPVFMNFDNGLHWIPVYRARLGGEAPALQLRVQTKFKPEGAPLPTDVPSSRGFPISFAARLVAARLAMLLGR